MDVEDPIQANYQLEVSSPGADRPFFKISQFEQYIGSTVLVNLFKAIDGRRKITGLIAKVVGDVVTLQEGEQVFEVPFDAMSKARLVPEYLIEKGGAVANKEILLVVDVFSNEKDIEKNCFSGYGISIRSGYDKTSRKSNQGTRCY